jgi:hypothetical protein
MVLSRKERVDVVLLAFVHGGRVVDLQRHAEQPLLEHGREMGLGRRQQDVADPLLHGFGAARRHPHAQVHEGVIALAVGHRVMRRRIRVDPVAPMGNSGAPASSRTATIVSHSVRHKAVISVSGSRSAV